MTSEDPDRRRQMRVPMRGSAWIIGEGGRQRVRLRNLSSKGVAFVSEVPLARGEQLSVALALNGRSWTRFLGVVRYATQCIDIYICGVDLRPSGFADLELLRAHVEHVRAQLARAGRSAPDAVRSPAQGQSKSVTPRRAPPPAQVDAALVREVPAPQAAAPSADPSVAEQRRLKTLYRAALKDLDSPR